ncbi:4'-phosphopantetheinyl transferase sfp [compost metagenome]
MISIINNPDFVLAYFKQENYEELLKNGINKRDLEKQGVQKLLNELGYGDLQISYKSTGQPYFEAKPDSFLSISHSKGWFAVILASKPVGIDVQVYSERLKAGQDYFRNDKEALFSEDETALHLMWCAKEAFYKWKEGEVVDLKEDVSLLKIEEENLLVDFEKTEYLLKYKLIEDAFLVFVSE